MYNGRVGAKDATHNKPGPPRGAESRILMSDLTLTEANYTVLMAAVGPKGLDPKAPAVGAMVLVNGLTDSDKNRAKVVSTFNALRSQRAASDALKALQETAGKVSLSSKGLLTLLNASESYLAQFGGEKGKVTFTLVPTKNDKDKVTGATVSVSVGSKRGATGGTKSKNSRTSAWVAIQRGVKGGDSLKFSKVMGDKNGKKVCTGYTDDAKNKRPIPSGKLTEYLGKVYPNSKAVAILKEYGQL